MKPSSPFLAGRSELVRALAAHRDALVRVGLVSLLVNLLMLTPTLYMLQVYDRVVVSRNELTLLAVSLIALLLFAVIAGAEALRSRLLVKASAAIEARLGLRVFGAAFEASLNPLSGDGARALGDLTTLRQFLTGQAVFAFFDAPWTPIYILVLYLLHPALGAAALLFGILQTVLAAWSHRQSVAPAQQAADAAQREQALVGGISRNAEAVEAMGMAPALHQRWAGLRRERRDSAGAQQELGQRLGAVSKFTRQAQQSLILGLGALLVIDGQLTAGAMIAANVLTTRALAPIDTLVGSWRVAIAAREAFGRLERLLEGFPPREAHPVPAEPAGFVTLRQVSAMVPGREAPVLDYIDLKLEPGTVTALIGPSGSGKLTLARVIMGVWPDVRGEVLLDGEPLENFDRARLGPQLGYLPQDIELFEGSVADNIARFGQPDPNKVIVAAQACGLHEAILRLPRGYDTPVGEAGHLLSAGMRQRIGLARAVYGKPALVVLDEPNANLDEAGELALSRLLHHLGEIGSTVLVASHRPGVLGVAGRVVAMQAGRVRFDGPRDEVLAALRSRAPAADAPQPPGFDPLTAHP